tara:strand:- start:3439 stop:4113 length:675 start_codon:yes stop_codon:yes gene_type:complete
MANDMKSGVGYIIPAAGVVGFVMALFLGEFLISILITVLGILLWFLYMLVMESNIPKQMGNMIILFGVMLSIGIFMGFGVTQNLWGGFEFEPEGSILSLVILFFAILTGLNFRNQHNVLSSSNSTKSGNLSDDDRDFVMNAINQVKDSDSKKIDNDPKVIVVKQEAPQQIDQNKKEGLPASNTYDPYSMNNNPYFTYPPDYYYDDDYDEDDDYYEDWDEYEDED